MAFDFSYEEITPEEADFIINIYYAVSTLVYAGRNVTLVGLSNILNVSTNELSDYLPYIVTIQDKVESEVR